MERLPTISNEFLFIEGAEPLITISSIILHLLFAIRHLINIFNCWLLNFGDNLLCFYLNESIQNAS